MAQSSRKACFAVPLPTLQVLGHQPATVEHRQAPRFATPGRRTVRVALTTACSSPKETSPTEPAAPPSPTVSDSQPSKAPSGPNPIRWLRAQFTSPEQDRASTLRRYGLAAILSYGLFDAVTYTLSFLFSLRAYVASGRKLAWATLPQVLALMWGINNLSRPFRIAGALALAPVIDARVVKPVAAFFAARRAGRSDDSSGDDK